MKFLPEKVAATRRLLGLSQKRVHELILKGGDTSVSRQLISDLENGKVASDKRDEYLAAIITVFKAVDESRCRLGKKSMEIEWDDFFEGSGSTSQSTSAQRLFQVSEPAAAQLSLFNAGISELALGAMSRPLVETEASFLDNNSLVFEPENGQCFTSVSQELRRMLLMDGNSPLFQELKRIFPTGDQRLAIYVKRRIDEHFAEFLNQRGDNIFAFANSSGAGKTTFMSKTAIDLSREGHFVFFVNGSEVATNAEKDSILNATLEKSGYRKQQFSDAAGDFLFQGEAEAIDWDELARFASSHNRKVFFFVDALDRASAAVPGELAAITCLLIDQLFAKGFSDSVRVVLSCRSEVWKSEKIDSLFAQEGGHFHERTFIPKTLRGMEMTVGSANLESGCVSLDERSAETMERDEGWFTKQTYDAAFSLYQDYFELRFDNEEIFKKENESLLRQPLMMRLFFVSEHTLKLPTKRVLAKTYTRWQLIFQYVMKKREEIRRALDTRFEQLCDKGEHSVAINELITSTVLFLSVEVLCDPSNTIHRGELEKRAVEWLARTIDGEASDRVLGDVLSRGLRDKNSNRFFDWFRSEFPSLENVVECMFEAGINVELLAVVDGRIRFSLDLYYEFCLGRAVGNVILNKAHSPAVVLDALFYAPRTTVQELAANPQLETVFDRVEETPLFSNQFLANTLRFGILQIEQSAQVEEELGLLNGCLEYLSSKSFPYQKLACSIIRELAILDGEYLKNRKQSPIRNLLSTTQEPERLVSRQVKAIVEHCLVPISNRGDFVCRFALTQAIVSLRVANRQYADELLRDWKEIEVAAFESVEEFGECSSTAEMLRAISLIDAWGSSENKEDLEVLLDCLEIEIPSSESELRFWIRRMAAVSIVQFVKKQNSLSQKLSDSSGQAGLSEADLAGVCELFVDSITHSESKLESAMLSEQFVFYLFVSQRSDFDVVSNLLETTDNQWQKISILFAIINVHNQAISRSNLQGAKSAIDSEWRESLQQLIREVVAGWNGIVENAGPAQALTLDRFGHGLQLILQHPSERVTEDALFDLPVGQDMKVDTEKLQVMFSPEFLSTYFDNHHECKERIYSLLEHFNQLNELDSELVDHFEFVEPARLESKWLYHADPKFGLPIHEEFYVEKVRRLSAFLETREEERAAAKHLQVDIRPGSWGAALRSAGSVASAVDAAMQNRFSMAVCFNRPPGHLATNQICIFNNVAAGVRHAQRKLAIETRQAAKVSVVDVDAHHGLNLQQCFYADRNVAYVSIHQDNIHPGEGYVWQIGSDRFSKNQFHSGAGTTLNYPVPENAGSEFAKTFAQQELREHLQLHEPSIIFVACGADADFRDPFAQLKFDPESYYVYGKSIFDWRKAQAAISGREIPVVVAFEGGFGITNGGLAEPFEGLIRGLMGLEMPNHFGAIRPQALPLAQEPIDAIRSIVCERLGAKLPVAEITVHGDVRNILASGVVDEDVQHFEVGSRTFGLGAGVIPSDSGDSLERTGELIVCGGNSIIQCPIHKQPIVAASLDAPFYVGWNSVPQLWIRIRTWRSINLDGLLNAIVRSYDSSCSTLGIIGAIRTSSVASIRDKRLAMAPSKRNREAISPEADESFSIIDERYLNRFFDMGTEGLDGADSTIWITGAVSRLGPEFEEQRMGSQQVNRSFYHSPASQMQSEFRKHHIHFACLKESKLDKLWQASPIKHSQLESAIDDVADKAVLVSHLEELDVIDAYIGVQPLATGRSFH